MLRQFLFIEAKDQGIEIISPLIFSRPGFTKVLIYLEKK